MTQCKSGNKALADFSPQSDIASPLHKHHEVKNNNNTKSLDDSAVNASLERVPNDKLMNSSKRANARPPMVLVVYWRSPRHGSGRDETLREGGG